MTEKNELESRMLSAVEAGYERVLQPDTYESFCKIMARFAQFDVNNQILIWLRDPNAVCLASDKDIQTAGIDQVKKERQVLLLEPLVSIDTNAGDMPDHGQIDFKFRYQSGVYYSVSGISAFPGKYASDHFIRRFRYFTEASVVEDDSFVKGRHNLSLYDPHYNALFLRPGLTEEVRRKELLHQMMEYQYERRIKEDPAFFQHYSRPDKEGREQAKREWDKKYLVEYCAYLHFGIPYCKDSIHLVIDDLKDYSREQLKVFLFECSLELLQLIRALTGNFFSFYELFLARAFIFTENPEWIGTMIQTFLEQINRSLDRYEIRYLTTYARSMVKNILLLPAEQFKKLVDDNKCGKLLTCPVRYLEQ